MCSASNARIACWGGYSSSLNVQLRDVAVLWPGAFVVEIDHSLGGGSDSSDGAWASLGEDILHAIENDLSCQSTSNVHCGYGCSGDRKGNPPLLPPPRTLTGAMAYYSQPPSSIFYRDVLVPIQVFITGNILAWPLWATAPLLIEGTTEVCARAFDGARFSPRCTTSSLHRALP